MAKLVKRKKQKRNYDRLYIALTFIVFNLFVISSLFLRNMNNSLATKIQKVHLETSAIQLQNNAVAVEIQKLGISDRVNQIANANGMLHKQENITTIKKMNNKLGD